MSGGLDSVDGPPRWTPCGDAAIDWLMDRVARLLRHGDIDAAVPFLERALMVARSAPVRVEAHLALGRVLQAREEHGRATVHFRAAVDLSPRRADALYLLGLSQAHEENNRAASQTLAQAAEIAPDEPEILRALGVALASVGDDASADRHLARAAELAPDDVSVLESLASHHLKLGRFTACGEVVERAARLEPDSRLLKRLAKEAAYLVELSAASDEDASVDGGHHLRVALDGSLGEVERLFTESMVAKGFNEAQLVNARDCWRDFLRRRGLTRVRDPRVHAAAVEALLARLDVVDGSSRDAIADAHGVAPAQVARAYTEIVDALDVAMFDQRYSSQPCVVEQVEQEGEESGLEPEEVFRALLEDEYREYEEVHDREGSVEARLDREAFEDASIEYGSLLTREMMGLTLGKRERQRKRELERVLHVR